MGILFVSTLFFYTIVLFSTSFLVASARSVHLHYQNQSKNEAADLERRSLLTYRENRGNASFICSPDGPCVPCLYSEKNVEKYRCSETGYRIPLKCVEIVDDSKEMDVMKPQKDRSSPEKHINEDNISLKNRIVLQGSQEFHHLIRHFRLRKLLGASFTANAMKLGYISYRSCVPVVPEERLSVLGFEGIIVFLLLLSAPIVYFRGRRTISTSGAVRIPTNFRL